MDNIIVRPKTTILQRILHPNCRDDHSKVHYSNISQFASEHLFIMLMSREARTQSLNHRETCPMSETFDEKNTKKNLVSKLVYCFGSSRRKLMEFFVFLIT